jgi:hypothetical protein
MRTQESFYPEDGGDIFLRNVGSLKGKTNILGHLELHNEELQKLYSSPI